MNDGRSGPPERGNAARHSRRSILIGGLGALGGVVVGPAATSGAAELLGGRSLATERLQAVGPSTGGAPLALGVRRVVWSVPTTEPAFALTFDDGPDPEFTPRVLEVLRARGLHATFNMMGWNAVHHPQLAKAVVRDGHEVGNHTWTHLDLAYEDQRTTWDEIATGKARIAEVTGQVPRFFRPPRGELTGAALRSAARLDHDVLMYTMLGDVAGHETPAEVRRYVVEHVRPGYIVDFHDGIGRGTFDRKSANARNLIARRHAEIEALPKILDDLLARGLRPVSAGELLDLEQSPPAH